MRSFILIISLIIIVYFKNTSWVYFFYFTFALSLLSLLHSFFCKKDSPEAIPEKVSENELINEKLRNIKLNEFPNQDYLQLIRQPNKNFRDAAHMCYVQRLLGNSISVELFQRQFGMKDSELQELMSELFKAKILDKNSNNELQILISSESELKICVDNFYNFLSQASISELTEFRNEHFDFSSSSIIPAVSPWDVKDDVNHMDGYAFEYYCAALLIQNGYDNVEVTKGSGDQGIDILAYKDGIKYGIQCKCYSSDVGNKAVQEAFAGKTFYNCHVAVVLTNQHFTKSAKELAKSNQVLLWDREKLDDLIKTKSNGENFPC